MGHLPGLHLGAVAGAVDGGVDVGWIGSSAFRMRSSEKRRTIDGNEACPGGNVLSDCRSKLSRTCGRQLIYSIRVART